MTKNLRKRNAGFTLVELVVVVLIIGILSAVMIPGYTRSVETAKADDAAGVVTMIGQSNRMFRVDNNAYVANGGLVDACNSAACSAGSTDRCQLVACSYLGSRQWETLSYAYQAGTAVNCGIPGAPNGIACGKRTASATGAYDNWGYVMDTSGIVREYNGAPAPTK